MQQFKLNIVNREETGRRVARRLRAEGRIPGCVYSKGNARSISLSAVDFRNLKRSLSGAALIELVDEKGETALTSIQEVQRGVIKRDVSHVDFREVERGHAFVSQVPIHLVGETDCVGVRNEGGILDHKAHSVEIRCQPSALPDFVEADVKELAVGEAVHIGDLPKLDGIEYMGTPEQVIVSCQAPTLSAETEEPAESPDEVPASKVKSDDDD